MSRWDRLYLMTGKTVLVGALVAVIVWIGGKVYA
jgi:hypothetical protein